MRTAPLAVFCLALAVSCRCDERPDLVPPPSPRASDPSPPSPASSGPGAAPSSSAATSPAASPSTSPAASPSTSPAASPSTPTSPAPPTSPPTSTAPQAQPPAPTARPLPLTSAVALEPAGTTPLAASAENVVDPASTFRVELPLPLAEVRIVLTDGAGDHVPATSTREVAATTRVDLAPSKPLVPASRYVLRVEGASGADIRGSDGTAYAPAAIPLVAAGSPPPRAEPPRKKRRR